MNAAQRRMVELLEIFDGICRQEGLTYWLDHGTLLGAVRESGFIPWDDDLDVTMPREDYERFLKIAPLRLPETIFLQTKESDPATPVHYAKLRDRQSTYVDKWEEGRKIRYHQGIFIDIFPLNRIHVSRERVYARLLDFAKLFSNRYVKIDPVAEYLIRKINAFHDPKGELLVSGGETMHYVIHVPVEKVFPLSEVVFEGRKYPAPADATAYLATIFGESFMMPPPPEKRTSHSTKILVDTPCKKETDG
ncbi:LicD family protein [Hydrogenimonas cancrithermarum]|uniref:LPS cholinephosphotransferase n=1 Tax=Hydrogenimonas cancrithermarum TaxID=2993563 RepID=A0ABM8FNN2_9BACT|nr:LicD family protein [Hydrogenimonas cancrithermarum]BDY13172.1 LPS cholinephosphotransferase [Hydrogenimonas cancrithermarum]